MGTGSSQERLGERVLEARKKLKAVKKMQAARLAQLGEETQDVLVSSLEASLACCSPFSEATLLLAFSANPEETQRMLAKCCKKVLSAPVDKQEYAWFTQYVFSSTVWMMQTKSGSFLYEEMLAVTEGMAAKIDNSMDSIFVHLQSHPEWHSEGHREPHGRGASGRSASRAAAREGHQEPH